MVLGKEYKKTEAHCCDSNKSLEGHDSCYDVKNTECAVRV